MHAVLSAAWPRVHAHLHMIALQRVPLLGLMYAAMCGWLGSAFSQCLLFAARHPTSPSALLDKKTTFITKVYKYRILGKCRVRTEPSQLPTPCRSLRKTSVALAASHMGAAGSSPKVGMRPLSSLHKNRPLGHECHVFS